MDKSTRNRIQAATQKARALLEDEFGQQLEGVFDIRPDGTIGAIGPQLTSRQRVVREKILASIEHERSGGCSPIDAVATYTREAAFTTLNRFVALSMLEARGLLLPSISQGEQSGGFKEYAHLGLANGLVQLDDHGYRLYIESLFDEIAREVGVLFDRRDPASLLWPRRQSLAELLDVLNDDQLSLVWGEDETIGWVFQYFNTDDERKTMREPKLGVSQVPRNSRELAVRNQFFTPRYVVEFLTDNTLGRTWYEMRQGATNLTESCRYLVRHPEDVFLARGDEDARRAQGARADTGLEELKVKVACIPHRAKKDPRNLKLLDPACGSGHFLLYAFDLLQTVYEEAWEDEESPVFDVSETSLRDDYPTREALKAAVPSLILTHNLHGIDIDARCAQIAAFALWMRAQRAFGEAHVAPGARMAITRTNVVVAEPMPGDRGMREEFMLGLQPDLRELVKRIFDKMEIAGEVGSLLRIGEAMESAVRDVYGATGGLFADVDQQRWREAEEELAAALWAYVDSTKEGNTYARQLFTEDAARGLAFIDVCRQRYDVVLMNPPFGAFSESGEDYCRGNYSSASKNLAAAFVLRGHELATDDGSLGAIVDTTILQKSSYLGFREEVVLKDRNLAAFGWLGWEVLDAQVDASVLILQKHRASDLFLWVDGRAAPDDSLKDAVLAALSGANTSSSEFRSIRSVESSPNAALTADLVGMGGSSDGFRQRWAIARQGVAVPNAARFIRLHWEVPPENVGAQVRWSFLSHGGEYSPFFRDYGFVVDWEDDGARIKTDICVRYPYLKGNWGWVARNSSYYRQAGIAYGKRTDFLNTQVCPAGLIYSNEGSGVFPLHADEVWAVLAITNSPILASQLNSYCGQHKYSGYVDKLRVPALDPANKASLGRLAQTGYLVKRRLAATEEVSLHFSGVAPGEMTVAEYVENQLHDRETAKSEVMRIQTEIDDILFPGHAGAALRSDRYALQYSAADLVSFALGRVFGRWSAREATADEVDNHELTSVAFQELAVRGSSERHGTSILVGDPGHSQDIVKSLNDDLDALFSDAEGAPSAQVANALLSTGADASGIRDWVDKTLFSTHLARYSLGRRKAPIYWQLATPSASYSVWLYYHHLTRDTLYRVLNDFVAPKLQHEERRLSELAKTAGPSPIASQRKEMAAQQKCVDELRSFRDEVARIAPLWCPNLDDGVIINFAPLWRLAPHHRAWQKECRSCWNKLVAGDYDWAHLAMHLWPERVVPKCATDRSMACAHGLESVFWLEDENGNWASREVDQVAINQLVSRRKSPAVAAAVMDLMAAG